MAHVTRAGRLRQFDGGRAGLNVVAPRVRRLSTGLPSRVRSKSDRSTPTTASLNVREATPAGVLRGLGTIAAKVAVGADLSTVNDAETSLRSGLPSES